MTEDRPKITYGLTAIIKAIFNPLTIISVFGPMVVNIAMKQLRLILGEIKEDSKFAELSSIIKNPWGDAIIDFNIQYTVLLMALILAVSGILAILFSRIWKYPIETVINKIQKDWKILVLILVSLGLVIWLFSAFIIGNLSSPEIIELYKINAEQYAGSRRAFHLPPFKSPITIWRIVISLYGFFATLLFSNLLEEHFPSSASAIVDTSSGDEA